MKKVIAGKLSYLKYADVKFVHVPLYDELTPQKVEESLDLSKEEKLKIL